MRNPSRFSNRRILGIGLVLCIVGAIVAAYLLGMFHQAGLLS